MLSWKQEFAFIHISLVFIQKKKVKIKFNLLQLKTTTIQPENKAANQNKEEEEFFSDLFSRPRISKPALSG